MSFSNEVRNELARIIPIRDCCKNAELDAFITANGKMVHLEDKLLLRMISKNAAVARKMFKLIKDVYNFSCSVRVEEEKRFQKSRIYVVNVYLSTNDIEMLKLKGLIQDGDIKAGLKEDKYKKNCCRRAYMRGIFLCRGFINRPSGHYHMEILINDKKWARIIQKMMAKSGIEARNGERKNNSLLYIKESDQIADFLRLVEASQALLEFENVRIVKSVRNKVNRQVNCETANLAKTVEASLRQIGLIEKFIEKLGLEALPTDLRDLAILRVEYPDYSLKELGVMMEPAMSKSGMAYRMRKLEKYAQRNLGIF